MLLAVDIVAVVDVVELDDTEVAAEAAGTEIAAEADVVELEGIEASHLDSPILVDPAAKPRVFGVAQLTEEEE